MFFYCVTVCKDDSGHRGQNLGFFQIEVPCEESIARLDQLEGLEVSMRKVILSQEKENFDREYKLIQTMGGISKYKYIQQAMSQYKFIALSLLREE